MRHILIYLFIALGIFGLLGWYFARQDTLQPDIQKVTAEANAIKQTQRQVELLFDGTVELCPAAAGRGLCRFVGRAGG